jgi:hypothetical protein
LQNSYRHLIPSIAVSDAHRVSNSSTRSALQLISFDVRPSQCGK